METSLGRCNANVFGDTVVQNTFAKVVGLGLSSVGTSEFPINLVQVIGEQNHAANYAFTWGHLGDILDTSKEEEEVGIDGWSITLFPKVEHGAHSRVEGGVLVESAGPVAGKRLLLREIHEVRAGRETQAIGASNYENRQPLPKQDTRRLHTIQRITDCAHLSKGTRQCSDSSDGRN